MQELFIVILFLIALSYLGNMLYKQVKGNSSCSSNCNCGSPVVNNYKKVRNDAMKETVKN